MVHQLVPFIDAHFFVVHASSPIGQIMSHHTPARLPHPRRPIGCWRLCFWGDAARADQEYQPNNRGNEQLPKDLPRDSVLTTEDEGEFSRPEVHSSCAVSHPTSFGVPMTNE